MDPIHVAPFGNIRIQARPIPKLWHCSSSAERSPRAETGSIFGLVGCCSRPSVAVR